MVGTVKDPITLKLQQDLVEELKFPNFSGNLTNGDKSRVREFLHSNRTIRLIGGGWIGWSTYVGRLEVLSTVQATHSFGMTDILGTQAVWGTVCENGFDAQAAMLACAALGLLAHPQVSDSQYRII